MTAQSHGLAASGADSDLPPGEFKSRALEALTGRYRSLPVIASLLVIWLFFQSQNSAFLTVGNLTNLSLQIVTTALLALGVVFVLIVGEIDLSGAALGAVGATVAAVLTVLVGLPFWVALIAGIAFGVVVALLEALIVVFGVPSLITTLGGMVILEGALLVVLPEAFQVNVGGTPYAALASTKIPAAISVPVAVVACATYAAQRGRTWQRQRSQGDRPYLLIAGLVAFSLIVVGAIFVLSAARGLPLPVAILIGILIVASYFTTQTRFGSHMYAVGGNREAAARAGLPVARIVLYSFMVLGACAVLAGMVDASRVLGVSAASGKGSLMLNAIAAAIVGGVSLFGGRGTVWAALLGALVIGSITNGVQLLGLSTEIQLFATGGVLILAVAIDVVVTRGRLLPWRN
jgi:D-xylose transport system permease protein